MDCNLPGSSIHGILQAGILEWVPIPSPGELPDPGIEPGSPALQADSLLSEPQGIPILKHKYVDTHTYIYTIHSVREKTWMHSGSASGGEEFSLVQGSCMPEPVGVF